MTIQRDAVWSYAAKLLVVALLYVVVAKLSLSFAVTTKQVSAVWPPTAVALVITLLFGYRYLPGILLGAFTANAMTSEPALVAAGIGIGNTLEAAVGAWLLLRVAGFRLEFERARDLVWFMAVVGLVATPVSATIGVLSLALGGLVNWASYWPVWQTWWAGDAMGGLIVGPFLLVWASRACRQVLRSRPWEAVLIFGLTVAGGWLSFTVSLNPAWTLPLATYVIFPLLIWAAFRFDRVGVATGVIVVAETALLATLRDLGPFAMNGQGEHNLIFLQSFVLVLFGTMMFLAVTVARRNRAELELRRLTTELREANQRATDTLAEVLDQTTPRRSTARVRSDTVKG